MVWIGPSTSRGEARRRPVILRHAVANTIKVLEHYCPSWTGIADLRSSADTADARIKALETLCDRVADEWEQPGWTMEKYTKYRCELKAAGRGEEIGVGKIFKELPHGVQDGH